MSSWAADEPLTIEEAAFFACLSEKEQSEYILDRALELMEKREAEMARIIEEAGRAAERAWDEADRREEERRRDEAARRRRLREEEEADEARRNPDQTARRNGRAEGQTRRVRAEDASYRGTSATPRSEWSGSSYSGSPDSNWSSSSSNIGTPRSDWTASPGR